MNKNKKEAKNKKQNINGKKIMFLTKKDSL